MLTVGHRLSEFDTNARTDCPVDTYQINILPQLRLLHATIEVLQCSTFNLRDFVVWNVNRIMVGWFFLGFVPQKVKTEPFFILMAVCPSVKSIYLEIDWRYQAEMIIKYSSLWSLTT